MTSQVVAAVVRLLTGATGRWIGCAPDTRQRIYFANHTSHLDGPVLWAALPEPVRMLTRLVAARDYWAASRLRRHVAERVFKAVLIERKKPTPQDNPLDAMISALGTDQSLIVFPEGGRSSAPEPGPFKGGLFHLARKRPDVELVPVWMENLNRILPKGDVLPVPLLGSVTFGAPIQLQPEETKSAFLERARTAVISLRQQP
jgi:1-acyl-sn-glycerol-3-phosphate acyltransferase